MCQISLSHLYAKEHGTCLIDCIYQINSISILTYIWVYKCNYIQQQHAEVSHSKKIFQDGGVVWQLKWINELVLDSWVNKDIFNNNTCISALRQVSLEIIILCLERKDLAERWGMFNHDNYFIY